MKIDGGKEGEGRLLARFAKIYVLGIFRMNAPGVRNSSYTLERVTTMLKTLFRVAPRRLVSSLRFSEFSPFPPLPSPVFPVRDNGLTKQTRDSSSSPILYFLPFLFFQSESRCISFRGQSTKRGEEGIKVDGYRSLDLIPFPLSLYENIPTNYIFHEIYIYIYIYI